ncbi:hydrolase 1, exosortase A system-associated [uncultured Sphingomonas sp.]|uniref:hydrolase 1, exosortase A system-associated n=1 Tax=uncultured Sphingomonas sp. TaxID=158754 RepID=UPI0035CB37CB
MRRLIAFSCEKETLIGSLDEGSGTTGLLIVSGGNEIRIGAHRGMALLAARLAAGNIPVFRFDRRGIGESTGANAGYGGSAPDIAAAAAAFRAAAPHVARLVGFGNCDAATALALFHHDAGIDALVLANPWVGDEPDALPPAAAIRARYVRRLGDPRQWLRLISGAIDIGKLAKGLRKVVVTRREVTNLVAGRMAGTIATTPCTILLASGDNGAMRFAQAWRGVGPIERRDSDSHSFARPGDGDWLTEKIKRAISMENIAH